MEVVIGVVVLDVLLEDVLGVMVDTVVLEELVFQVVDELLGVVLEEDDPHVEVEVLLEEVVEPPYPLSPGRAETVLRFGQQMLSPRSNDGYETTHGSTYLEAKSATMATLAVLNIILMAVYGSSV